MGGPRFVWDGDKNRTNREKHGVSFEEASELFCGVDVLEIFDDAHSVSEDRFISIGPIPSGVAVVVWTEPEDDVVRIISARLATTRESTMYHIFIEGRRR